MVDEKKSSTAVQTKKTNFIGHYYEKGHSRLIELHDKVVISEKVSKKNTPMHFPTVFIFASVSLFLLRMVFFVAPYGAVEHDSGWLMGVAKNLALRGIYASYTNTITEEGVGGFPSIHGRFSVQDENGYSYFPAAVSVGPGYIVPEAAFIRVFGSGWWQYRAWPLICYAGLLLLLFSLAWRIGNLFSLIVFEAWLWTVPQLTVQFAYEAFSEHIALFYLLISFVIYYLSTRRDMKNLFYLTSGLFLSFSILTKSLFAVPGTTFIVLFLRELWIYRQEKKNLCIRWALFAAGLLAPYLSFELYRYISLTSQFGYAGWQTINKDISLNTQDAGSGLNNLSSLLSAPFSRINERKMNIWLDVGIQQYFSLWDILLISPFVVFKFIRREKRVLALMLYLAIAFSFLWFIVISPNEWSRHVWQGIVLGMLMVSIAVGLPVQSVFSLKRKVAYIALCVLITAGMLNYQVLEPRLLLDQHSIDKWQTVRFIHGSDGFPHTGIFSMDDQQATLNYFDAHVHKEDRIYYEGWFLVAEVSPLADKVFYPLDRYFNDRKKNPNGGLSYLIFGPYQQGQWSIVPPDYIRSKIASLCNIVVLQNSSYTLCTLK